MTRYFYTDPLAAAWMAKHFGMRLQAWDGTIPGYRDIEVLPLVDSERYFQRCIHPDSLHLLDVQIGDYVDAGGRGAWLVIASCSNGRHHPQSAPINKMAGRQVLQRDGKPFFWPEREE